MTEQPVQTQSPIPPGVSPARVATSFVIKLVVLTLALGFGEAYIMHLSQTGHEPDWVYGLREWSAAMGAWLAGLFESEVVLDEVTVTGTGIPLIVSVECTALFAKGLFCAAAIAYPCRLRDTVIGCVVGLVGVAGLNVLRIAGLVLISSWTPKFFHFAHMVLMQWFLISCVAPLWLVWAAWATKRAARVRKCEGSNGGSAS